MVLTTVCTVFAFRKTIVTDLKNKTRFASNAGRVKSHLARHPYLGCSGDESRSLALAPTEAGPDDGHGGQLSAGDLRCEFGNDGYFRSEPGERLRVSTEAVSLKRLGGFVRRPAPVWIAQSERAQFS